MTTNIPITENHFDRNLEEVVLQIQVLILYKAKVIEEKGSLIGLLDQEKENDNDNKLMN